MQVGCWQPTCMA